MIAIPRPEITAFAARMEAVMKSHDGNLGDSWKTAARSELMSGMSNAVVSLEKASRRKDAADKFIEQCVDVANFCMMLAWSHLHFGKLRYDGLTEAQSRIMDFIVTYIAEHGFSPSYREILKHTGGGNLTTIQEHIIALVRRGFIEITPKSGRSIRLKGQKRLPQPPRRRQTLV